jgi:Spy/CpxP family protein refolding chaperone
MKPTIIICALTAVLASSIVYNPSAIAHQEPGMDKMHNREKAMFAQLALTDEQKQDIELILRQTRGNNMALRADKNLKREQLSALMSLAQWDDALAQQLVEEQEASKVQAQLNRALARNKAYQVLTDEQKAKLGQSIAQGDRSGKAKRSKKDKGEKRMAKVLGLSDAQKAELTTMRETWRVQNESLRAQIKEYRSAERALIHSENFDEQAWLALNQSIQPTLQALQVNQLHARFDMQSVLDDEQLELLHAMKKRLGKGKKERRAKQMM